MLRSACFKKQEHASTMLLYGIAAVVLLVVGVCLTRVVTARDSQRSIEFVFLSGTGLEEDDFQPAVEWFESELDISLEGHVSYRLIESDGIHPLVDFEDADRPCEVIPSKFDFEPDSTSLVVYVGGAIRSVALTQLLGGLACGGLSSQCDGWEVPAFVAIDASVADDRDFSSLIAHEFGHLGGLRHPNSSESCIEGPVGQLMEPYLMDGQTELGYGKLTEAEIVGLRNVFE